MGPSILQTMKTWRILLILISLGFVMLLVACGDTETTPEPAPGDPTQAAYAFMIALLNGDITGCEGYSTEAVRESILQTCQAYADAEANTDLTGVSFIVLAREGQDALIEMRGIYTISSIEEGSRISRQENTPVRILMRYEDDFWRFDDFPN